MAETNQRDTPGVGGGDVDLNYLYTASSGATETEGEGQDPGEQSPPLTAQSLGNLDDGKHPKPQVIVRIRPSSTTEDNLFEVDPDTKTIQIRVDREEYGKSGKLKHPPGFIYFQADNVLEDSTQEDTFTMVAMDVVQKGMRGKPGMIVAVGPELSGKSFSLFGLNGRYQNRGMIVHAMEKLFELKETSEEEYKVGLGVIEVRRERIRDLLTLDPREINDVGDRGPRGMYMEDLDSLEHGIGLLMRALIGQKLIHQEPFEKYHTIVYLEIVAVSPDTPGVIYFESRLTFAEISSVPSDSVQTPTNSEPAPPPQSRPSSKSRKPTATVPSKKCCNPGYATGPLAESIAVRRDIFTLEQIFNRACERQRVRAYFAKVERLGLSMMASEKRRLSSGHDFRQSRLAHCLKDIMDSGTVIKILLHVRPDKAHLKSTLEAMRFAKRAHLVTSNVDGDTGKGKSDRTEEQILHEMIAEIAPEIAPSEMESLTVDKIKAIREHAVEHFDDNINSMKVCSKDKVKLMFKDFRIVWNSLWQLEHTISLGKVEDELKQLHEQLAKTRESDGGEGDAVSKKSSKKMKKEKAKKGKKPKTPQDQQPESGLETASSKRDSASAAGHEGADSGHHPQRPKASILPPKEHQHDDASSGKQPISGQSEGEEEDARPRDRSGSHPMEKRLSAGDAPPHLHKGSLTGEPRLSTAETPVEPLESHGSEEHEHTHDPSNPTTSKLSGEVSVDELEAGRGSQSHPRGSTGTGSRQLEHAPQVIPSSIATHGFSEFKFPRNQQDLSEEELERVSNDFEEMKKVARKQAISLLKAGIGKPQWMK